jgi:gliding motility-associated lipoprotein GldD
VKTPHSFIGHAACLAAAICAAALLCACNNNQQGIPKPRGYYRISLPAEHTYTTLNLKNYPYTFSIPTYATAIPNTSPSSDPYWLDVDFAQYNAKIYLSYKPVRGNFDKLIEDVHFLVYKHTVKADGITQQRFVSSNGKTFGYLYELEGNAACNVQFYVTDSVRNFLRGSLYFNIQPNRDSLAPVIEFITEDIRILMESVRWNQ